MNALALGNFRHFKYWEQYTESMLWRTAYEGGQPFIDEYLERFSAKEDDAEFVLRKRITYPPVFAKAAINEVKNSIYTRMSDIVRTGGTPSYQAAVLTNVDNRDNSMNSFIGCEVLEELLVMGRVGVFIDMPKQKGPALIDNVNSRPYLYIYRAEDILGWSEDQSGGFRSVFLRDYQAGYDEFTGMPTNLNETYRHLWSENGRVYAQLYGKASDSGNGNQTVDPLSSISEVIELDLPQIPFTYICLPTSLMKDIAYYQVALLQLASSDMSVITKSGFPIYTEQFDPQAEVSRFIRNGDGDDDEISSDATAPQTVNLGSVTGRRYPKGTDRPDFIHPSVEPIKLSMEKQKQLKEEIRLILNLTISNLDPQRVSSGAKKQDSEGLAAGLSFIGLKLQTAESQIAKVWSAYEAKDQVAIVTYPDTYDAESDSERLTKSKDMIDLSTKVNSLTFKREVQKSR